MTDSIDIVVQIIAIPIAIAILVNALEDSFIDANYYLRGLFRTRFRRVRRDDLDQALPKRIAVVIPAWRESAVIERMIDHLLATVDYDPACYDVFCGTYPNDPETGER